MRFDKKIEKIYLANEDWEIENALREIIASYPRKHRLLIGLRATFIKQQLMLSGKIDREEHEKNKCASCIVSERADGTSDCWLCPLQGYCARRSLNPQEQNVEIVYEAYMAEHRKFEK